MKAYSAFLIEDKTLYLVKAAVGSGTDQLASSASDIPVGLMKDESSSFMKNMMKNPFMEQLLSNPVVMKSMMTSNPQLKKLCEENPELEHALQDPATLQEMMKAMSNPEYHKEMMKNNDRIMSNIEMLPEGFNALRKVYTTIQEPLMEGLDEANMAKLKSDAQAIEQRKFFCFFTGPPYLVSIHGVYSAAGPTTGQGTDTKSLGEFKHICHV